MTAEPGADEGWQTRLRAIVLHPSEPRLLALRDGPGLALPERKLPGRLWSAEAPEFVGPLRDLVQRDVIQLWCASDWERAADCVFEVMIVFSTRDERAALPPNATWIPPGELTSAGRPAHVVAQVFRELADGRLPPGRVPWSVRGWFPTAEQWVTSSLASLGRPVTGAVEQVQHGELSSVLRAPTGNGDVYFKATKIAPLFVNEGVFMASLARLFPEHVPAPLAVDPERRWMLLDDLGPMIGYESPTEVREEMLRAFARLQLRSAGLVDRLIAAGGFDRRLDRLAASAIERLTAADLSRWVSAEEAAELEALAPRLASLCAELARLPVPATLLHGDLHLGNVARGGSDFMFFDWSDACVGHPFLDMITLFRGDDVDSHDRLRDVYLAEWAEYASPAELLQAWRLSRPLGALHQAISYFSIASSLEPDTDRDGMVAATGRWLSRLLTNVRAY